MLRLRKKQNKLIPNRFEEEKKRNLYLIVGACPRKHVYPKRCDQPENQAGAQLEKRVLETGRQVRILAVHI